MKNLIIILSVLALTASCEKSETNEVMPAQKSLSVPLKGGTSTIECDTMVYRLDSYVDTTVTPHDTVFWAHYSGYHLWHFNYIASVDSTWCPFFATPNMDTSYLNIGLTQQQLYYDVYTNIRTVPENCAAQAPPAPSN